jgi:hypothetical protein
MRLRGTPTTDIALADGNFFTPANWTAGAGWTIQDGQGDAVTSSANLTNTSGITAVSGKVYLIRYYITRTAGSVSIQFGGTTGVSRSATGMYEEYITTVSTGGFSYIPVGFSGNVSQLQVFPADSADVRAPYFLTADGSDDFYEAAYVQSAYPLTLAVKARTYSEAAGVSGAVTVWQGNTQHKVIRTISGGVDWNASSLTFNAWGSFRAVDEVYFAEFATSTLDAESYLQAGAQVVNTNAFGTSSKVYVGTARSGDSRMHGRIEGVLVINKILSATEKANVRRYWSADNAFQAWGDSMTAGSGTAIFASYPVRLQRMAGLYVEQKGAGGETSAQVTTRFVADTTNKDQFIQLLCMGTNDNWVGDGWSPTFANIDTCIAGTKGRTRWLVMPPYRAEAGSVTKSALEAFDAEALTKYGTRFCNVRAYLMTKGDGSANDIADIADGLVPRSLRSDTIHLNDKGYQLKAEYIYQHLKSMGWL